MMQKSEKEPLLEDYDVVDEDKVVDYSSDETMKKNRFYLVHFGLFFVTAIVLFTGPIFLIVTSDSPYFLDKIPAMFYAKVQEGVCLEKDNSLGCILKERLRENSFKLNGLFNSYQQKKNAYMVKLKVRVSGPEHLPKGSEAVEILYFGKTQFRQNFIQKTNIGVTFESSAEYINNKLRSPYQLKEDVMVTKYPAIREPPGSIKFNDTQDQYYIFEYVGLCPHQLLKHVRKQDNIAVSKIQLEQLSHSIRHNFNFETLKKEGVPDYELINIVNNGPSENRIDVVFMGDGYTKDERDKFVDDMTRLSTEMFEGETFKSWLPLINVWAVFVPSEESGIGSGGKPKKTPFGLYRDGTELRGIYSSKQENARAICNHLGYALCDFPSMIGNDDYYGGLGGEYIISTRSILSGTVVLRHEMGHTFNDVGEEYDGGEVYEGVNASPKLEDIHWKHWLTDLENNDIPEVSYLKKKKNNKFIKEEKNSLAIQDYSWHDLSKNGPYILTFNSTGKYPRWYIQISTSGMSKDGSFKAYLDDIELPWKAPGTLDRTFSTWFNDTHGLSKGSHQLRFEAKQGLPKGPIIHQLCNVEMIEYAKEKKFHWNDEDRVSVYPTYDYKHKKSYRPTNEYCLMRNMTSQHFCPVCKEGLWMKFLDRVSVLDNLEIRQVRLPSHGGSDSLVQTKSDLIPHPDHTYMNFITKTLYNDFASENSKEKHPKFTMAYFVEAKLINLIPSHDKNHKHNIDKDQKFGYTLHWYFNGNRVSQLDDETAFLVPETSPYITGVWELNVQFTTPQVRKDPNSLLTSQQLFILKKPYV